MFFKKKSQGNNIDWSQLNSVDQLDQIIDESTQQSIVIFKHSTRCSISSTALSRFERSWSDNENNSIKPYYLDLLSHRDISNKIEAKFGIQHQSPQAILIKNGKVIHNSSHFDISLDTIITESQK